MIRSGANGLCPVLQLAVDSLALVASALQSRTRLGGESIPPPAAGAVRRASGDTATAGQGDLGRHGRSLAMDRLAGPARRGEAGHAPPMAPSRVPAAVALQVPPCRAVLQFPLTCRR